MTWEWRWEWVALREAHRLPYVSSLSLLRGPPSAYISSRNIHCMCGRFRVKGQEKQVPVNPHCIQEQLIHYHTKEHVKGINHF